MKQFLFTVTTESYTVKVAQKYFFVELLKINVHKRFLNHLRYVVTNVEIQKKT